MKIKVHLSIGFVGGNHEDVLDVEDDASDSECEQACQEWAGNYIETFWERTK